MWVWFSGAIGVALLFKKGRWNTPVELCGLLFLAGMAAACPGLYFRNHYFLMAMPGLALLNAFFILTVAGTLKKLQPAWLVQMRCHLAWHVRLILGNLIPDNYKMWFGMNPLQISRVLYGNSPYPESSRRREVFE